MEKIPYMKELGVTTLELMPVTEFNEVREETEVSTVKLPVDNQPPKLNYWGYGDSFLFAPKASYSSPDLPSTEHFSIRIRKPSLFCLKAIHKTAFDLPVCL